MTAVRGKRGRLVHAWMPHGKRRDLCPDEIPSLICGRRMKGVIVVDEHVDCPACVSILFEGN